MSNKRIGCENFGKFYTEGKVRNRREWRGVTDTLYDYSRWLHNWITMAKMVSKPRNIKAMFRYRWMANYLAVPMMVDRHTQGLRDEYLRICHLEQDLIIEDVAKLLDGLFRGDRRIGKDKKFSDKVVLVDENEMTAVMMGFPTLKGLSRETPSTYVSVLLNQHAAEHYIDVAQEYGLAGDVCPMPEAEAGVSIDDDAPCSATRRATAPCSETASFPSASSLRTAFRCSSWQRPCATARTTCRITLHRRSKMPSPSSRSTPARSGTGRRTSSAPSA